MGGRGWERGKAEASSLALLSEKGLGREGSIESQQKSDFFCSESLPKGRVQKKKKIWNFLDLVGRWV